MRPLSIGDASNSFVRSLVRSARKLPLNSRYGYTNGVDEHKKKRQHIKSSVCTMYMYTAHSIVFVMHVDLSFFRRSDGFFFFFRLAYLNSTIRTLTHFHRVSCKTTKNHWMIRLRKEKSDYWLHLNMKSSEIKMLRDLPNKNKIIQL